MLNTLRAPAPTHIALAIALLLSGPGHALAATRVIATQGQSISGAQANFLFFSDIQLNNAGQVAFKATLDGALVKPASNSALFIDNALIVRTGDAAGTADNASFASLAGLKLNDAGQIAFIAGLSGTKVITGNDSALYRDGTLIVREGSDALGSTVQFGTFSSLAFNNAGQLAYITSLTGTEVTSSTNSAIFKDQSLVMRTGTTTVSTSGTTISTTRSSLSNATINDLGQVGYIFGHIAGNAPAINQLTLAAGGQPIPGATTGEVWRDIFSTPLLNNKGQVAFSGTFTDADTLFGVAIVRDTTLIAHTGDAAPSLLTGISFDALSLRDFNNAGQTLYLATLKGIGINFPLNDRALYRDSTLIARTGNTLADLPAGITLSGIGNESMNDTGQVAYRARLTGTGIGSLNDEAILVSDGIETLQVARRGDAFGDGTISSFSIVGKVNDFGQVAYTFISSLGKSTIALFTPDLNWRAKVSGAWDTVSNWTLGLAPALVHALKIDTASSVTVTGPTSDVTVKSLTVGGGAGIATLKLAGGAVNALSGVEIASTGVLTGDGRITGGVHNTGTVRAANLTIQGGLNNEGKVLGSGTINADLTQKASGQLRVGAGEAMLLNGKAHSNAGVIEVRNGGSLEVNGKLEQSATGRTLVSDGTLRFNDGLRNAGELNVSFGGASVFGQVSNAAGGKIILSGNSQTAFFDQVDAAAGSELRVSNGSTAVFFGQVQQRTGAIFSGTGTKFYEGGLSVGNSPGSASDAGNVNFGASNLYLAELGGTEAGTGFDYYNVAGSLSFGGTLKLVSYNGFTGQAGQSFDLFDWGSSSGNFDTIDSTGFALAEGTQLDLSRLYQDGSISVTAVPEPGSYAMLLAGLGLLGFMARRRIAR